MPPEATVRARTRETAAHARSPRPRRVLPEEKRRRAGMRGGGATRAPAHRPLALAPPSPAASALFPPSGGAGA